MKLKLRPIHDQVVVLVGATSGIGLETAMIMVEKGARVVIVGRSQEGLNDAQERVRSHAEASRIQRMYDSNGGQHSYLPGETGGEAIAVADQVISLEGDITDFEQMRSVAEQVVQRFGRIDTWVNLAGVSEWALFEDTSPDEFRRIVDVNLVGQAYGAMAALPYLRQQRGGTLIFVSSVAGRVPIPYQSAYNASKHGLIGLIETLRQELKHTEAPVNVTNILPASINTPLFDKARTKIGVEPDPFPPIYDTKMVAKAIAYAASHPVRELIVGDAGYMVTFMRRLAPTLTSNYLGATGFRKQRSDEPKSAQAPDNLYQHLPGYNQVSGEYGHRTRQISPLTWFSTHPRARLALYSGMLALAGGLIGWRVVKARNEKRNTLRYRLPREASRIRKDTGTRARKAFEVAGASIAAIPEHIPDMPSLQRHQKGFTKKASQALHDAGEAITSMPVISDLPMFRQPTMAERASQTVAGVWAAILAALPLRRRKTLRQRIASRLRDINLPKASDIHLPDVNLPKVSDIHLPEVELPEVHMPEVNLPWRKNKGFVEKVTVIDERKVGDKVAKSARKAHKEIVSHHKDVSRAVRKARQKGLFSKEPVIERLEEFVEKVTYRD